MTTHQPGPELDARVGAAIGDMPFWHNNGYRPYSTNDCYCVMLMKWLRAHVGQYGAVELNLFADDPDCEVRILVNRGAVLLMQEIRESGETPSLALCAAVLAVSGKLDR